MNILYYVPHVNTVYANRTIIDGYKNAFLDLGHNFRYLTASDNQLDVVEEFSVGVTVVDVETYGLGFPSNRIPAGPLHE